MKFTSFRTICAACAMVGLAGGAQAQSGFATEPQNLPPSSFTGDTFVDNAGCIFVRAGFNGNVTWVPRVSRSREQVCGQTPTFPDTAVAATDTAQPETAQPRATQQQAAPAQQAQAAPEPAAPPAPRSMANASPTPAVQPRAAVPPRIMTSAPMRGAGMAGGMPRIVPAPLISSPVPTASVAPERAAPPRDSAPAGLSAESWIVPRHVYENRSTARPTVPAGFRPAWDDDRLNRWRAWQKPEGYAATQRIWTNTVPRRQITSGDPAPEIAQPEVAYRGTGPAPREQLVLRSDGSLRSNFGGPAVFVSTRGAPAQQAAPAPRFLHVGAFTSEAGAQAAAARLGAAGLPVRFGTQRRDGAMLRAVLVGPFASDAGMQSALTRVRAAGYGTARVN